MIMELFDFVSEILVEFPLVLKPTHIFAFADDAISANVITS